MAISLSVSASILSDSPGIVLRIALDQLCDDEFPGYFREIDDRLFSSRSETLYPLPVDGREQERQRKMHALLRKFAGELCDGPVKRYLSQRSYDERTSVLDIGTGTGDWLLDLSQDFPYAFLIGIDIAPISTRYPPPNVTVHMQDFTEVLPYRNQTMDVVHARLISLSLRSYDFLVSEASRILRPGGLFSACEWTRSFLMADGGHVPARAPGASAFLVALQHALLQKIGVGPIAYDLPRAVHQSGNFHHISVTFMHIPIGTWPTDGAFRSIGREYREVLVEYACSMRPFLAQSVPAVHLQELIEGFISDLYTVPALMSAYVVVHATRL
ncbi:S-adenosyl-L-methionine-dependent methyltransferase [Trametes cingulata]|nr:S-adenosyl-L-methionine-dependent methyltransferase [Trametes cingulata]